VIDRAGLFDSEHTYMDTTGVKVAEAVGGTLSCKRFLFFNWVPPTNTNDVDDLQKSIQAFISKSIEYAINKKDTTSIAFTISDGCANEMILAQEMIAAAKQQLESTNLSLKILFVLLPEQQTLHNHFFTAVAATQDIYAYFNWPTAGKIDLNERIACYFVHCSN
jgi:hypothetical protein